MDPSPHNLSSNLESIFSNLEVDLFVTRFNTLFQVFSPSLYPQASLTIRVVVFPGGVLPWTQTVPVDCESLCLCSEGSALSVASVFVDFWLISRDRYPKIVDELVSRSGDP